MSDAQPPGNAMNGDNAIERIEAYARRFMSAEPGHDFAHVSRVRHWALRIARAEGYPDLAAVEAAALLHDIGLASAEDRATHGARGADMARRFLLDEALFPADTVDAICHAIRYHCTNREGSGPLLGILRDADMMDMFGAIGVLRCIQFAGDKPGFDPANPKGPLWNMTAAGFDARIDRALGTGDTIVDVLNFHISCYDNLATDTARRLARPGVDFIRRFILELEADVAGEPGPGEPAQSDEYDNGVGEGV
ncbi:MAG: HD domain-containing protein [Candidatus Hydrogenedentes bacterium]|nr:HD domain-containing protein [Candidatus Hydrogenedentota bacterium]